MVLASFKAWFFVLCTAFQTVIAVVALAWFSHFLKGKEVRRTKEQQIRHEREKIPSFVMDYCRSRSLTACLVRNKKKKLEKLVIFARKTEKVTGIDIFRYMCEQEDTTHNGTFKTQDFQTLKNDIEGFTLIFDRLKLLLPLAEKECSHNITKAMKNWISVVSELVFDLASKEKQQIINEVMKELDLPEPVSSSHVDVKICLPYVDRLTFGMSPQGTTTLSEASSDFLEYASSSGDMDGHVEFHFQPKQSVSSQEYHTLGILDTLISNGFLETRLKNIADCMQEFWTAYFKEEDLFDVDQPDFLAVNLLHGVRVLKNELINDTIAAGNDQFSKLIREIESILNSNEKTAIGSLKKCKNLNCYVAKFFCLFNQSGNHYLQVLGESTTVEFMEKLMEDLEEFNTKNV